MPAWGNIICCSCLLGSTQDKFKFFVISWKKWPYGVSILNLTGGCNRKFNILANLMLIKAVEVQPVSTRNISSMFGCFLFKGNLLTKSFIFICGADGDISNTFSSYF